MKKTVLTIICILFINSGCFALDNTTAQIQQLEKTYFGYDYPGEVNNKRLDRLEKAIYGTTSQSAPSQRISKLTKDMQVMSNPQPQQSDIASAQSQVEELPPAEKDVKYPVVDKIEQKIFNKNFQSEDIYKRLSRLEKQVYKKESNASLNERVDSLRASVLANSRVTTDDTVLDGYDPGLANADSGWSDEINDNQYNYYTPQNTKNRIAQPARQSYGYDQGSSQGYDIEILEKSVLGKKFQGESQSQRLARLENSVFQKTFNDGEDARIQRLLAATTAQKTAKHYDSNKLMQRVNTGIQIGGILLMVLAMIL